MSARFRVTYEVTTPESAERGDYAESGFLNASGAPVEAFIGRPTPGVAMSLRAAVALVHTGALEDSGTWFTEADGRRDHQTGAEERRSLHPPDNVTAASYGRLARLLGAAT